MKKEEHKEIMDMLQHVVGAVSDLDTKVSDLDTKVTNLDVKVNTIEQKLDNKVDKEEFNDFKNTVYTMLDRDVKHTEENKMEITALHYRMDRYDAKLEELAK